MNGETLDGEDVDVDVERGEENIGKQATKTRMAETKRQHEQQQTEEITIQVDIRSNRMGKVGVPSSFSSSIYTVGADYSRLHLISERRQANRELQQLRCSEDLPKTTILIFLNVLQ